MSGDFVQRGEPALLNRWERAETALREGADIVAELPVFILCRVLKFLQEVLLEF